MPKRTSVYDYPASVFDMDAEALSSEELEDEQERMCLPQYVDPQVTIYRLQNIILKQRHEIKDLRKQLSDQITGSIKHSEAMSGMVLRSLLKGTDPKTFLTDEELRTTEEAKDADR